jgi:hypothetical protein
MSKRLQVILEDAEWREIQRASRAQRLTIAAWVRNALRVARQRQPLGDTAKKLEVVRAATRHAFPTSDIEQMLAEIDRGYRGGAPRDLR